MTEKVAYKTRHIRMSDKTWEEFKRKKALSGKSWNLYLMGLIEENKQKHGNNN